jgi:catalase
MQWDFWTLSPESAHQVTILMGDRGIPRSWRHMNGYSSHTYMWINAGGERFWVKYHFKTDQGVEFLTQGEGTAMAGENPDAHIHDLWASIKKGDLPTWTLNVQIMPFEDAANYRFNPFDVTKVLPHGDYPLIKVGRYVLDRNPEDYFAEIEQATFEPSNFIPGIGPSPDRMLLGRLFSYHDTHLHRVGTNAQQLTVNYPKHAKVNSYNKDGAMRYRNPGDPVYAPNSFGGPAAAPQLFGEDPAWEVTGEIVRAAQALHREDDDFGQAGTMVREVLDDSARDRLVSNIAGHVKQGVEEPVLSRVFDYWRNVDHKLGDRVEEAVIGRVVAKIV